MHAGFGGIQFGGKNPITPTGVVGADSGQIEHTT